MSCSGRHSVTSVEQWVYHTTVCYNIYVYKYIYIYIYIYKYWIVFDDPSLISSRRTPRKVWKKRRRWMEMGLDGFSSFSSTFKVSFDGKKRLLPESQIAKVASPCERKRGYSHCCGTFSATSPFPSFLGACADGLLLTLWPIVADNVWYILLFVWYTQWIFWLCFVQSSFQHLKLE